MYGFVDTVTRSTQSDYSSLRTFFGGVDIDKALSDSDGSFRTLSISGRGVLPRRIRTTETPNSHGVREGKYTYEAREIVVRYKLTDRTNKGFRERFNRLNGLLIGSKKPLEFTDEDAHFIATLLGGDTPEEDSNNIIGTLVFLCSDPAKRKGKQFLDITTTFSAFEIKGQAETPWTTRAVFTVPQSSFTIEADNGLYVLLNYNFIAGDVLEVDYYKREVKLNGKNLAVSVSLSTVWKQLGVGYLNIKSSVNSMLRYDERYF